MGQSRDLARNFGGDGASERRLTVESGRPQGCDCVEKLLMCSWVKPATSCYLVPYRSLQPSCSLINGAQELKEMWSKKWSLHRILREVVVHCLTLLVVVLQSILKSTLGVVWSVR